MQIIRQLGRVNLTLDPAEPPLHVDFERFLAFSYEIAESLQDLMARLPSDVKIIRPAIDELTANQNRANRWALTAE